MRETRRGVPTWATAQTSRRQALQALTRGGVGLLGIALIGCGTSTPTTAPAPATTVPSPTSAPTSLAAQAAPAQVGAAAPVTWDDLVSAAQKEGTVVVGGPPDPDARTKLPDAFKQRFGLDMDYEAGNSSQLAARIQSERAAGQYTIDVSVGGSDTVYGTFLPNNWLDPLKPWLVMPEVADPSVWPTGGPWFRDPSGATSLQIFNTLSQAQPTLNTSIVSPDDVKTLDDLLDPQWQGKIAAFDPGTNGAGLVFAAQVYLSKGPDYATQLYKGQSIALSRDYQQLADWVAHGTYPICLSVVQQYLAPYVGSVPIQVINFPDLEPATAGGFGIVSYWNNAPHPNAAKVFANWIASKEGVALYGQIDGSAPVRTDVPVTWLPPDQVPQPGGNYLDTYDYTFETTQRLTVRDFFANLLK